MWKPEQRNELDNIKIIFSYNHDEDDDPEDVEGIENDLSNIGAASLPTGQTNKKKKYLNTSQNNDFEINDISEVD